jgi:hypothetical protein
MMITNEQLNEYVGKVVYLTRKDGFIERFDNTTMSALIERNLPIQIMKLGSALIYCVVPPYDDNPAKEIKLSLKNNGRKWHMFSIRGETFSNDGRTHCYKCSCPTTMKRDFATFVVRLICPRCHF